MILEIKKIGDYRTLRLSRNVILYITYFAKSLLKLEFADNRSIKRDIPEGVEVYVFDSEDKTRKCVLEPSIKEQYILCLANKYELMYNNKLILASEIVPNAKHKTL